MWYTHTYMKHIRIHLALFFALVLLMTPQSYAQTAKPSTPQATISSGLDTTTETVSERKIRVDAELRDLLTRLGTAYARIQTTLTQVRDKNISLEITQTELTLAGAALQTAKADIDAFSKIALTEGAQSASTTLALRTSAQKSEDSLKAARTHLIASITALKAALLARSEIE